MDNKEFIALSQSIVGLIACQNLLFQYLIKRGFINKNDISNAIDFLMDDFNAKTPSQAITITMKHIRDGLDRDLPDFPSPPPEPHRPKNNHPDWLRGIIEGGKK